MKCKSCAVPLNEPIKDGRGFLPVYIDSQIGRKVERTGPYCPPCQQRLLSGQSLWADGKWRPRGAEQEMIRTGNYG